MMNLCRLSCNHHFFTYTPTKSQYCCVRQCVSFQLKCSKLSQVSDEKLIFQNPIFYLGLSASVLFYFIARNIDLCCFFFCPAEILSVNMLRFLSSKTVDSADDLCRPDWLTDCIIDKRLMFYHLSRGRPRFVYVILAARFILLRDSILRKAS